MVFIFFISIISILHFSAAVDDTLATNQTLSDDGGTMLVSASQMFVLGFFSPGSSRNRYLGIWVRNEPERTVVWVANNNNPISDFSGVLRLTPTGDLIISTGIKNNPVLQLLDNGNLVVKNGIGDSGFIWQSFDYPGDTLLPGMKIGWNLKTKEEWYLRSWRSQNDPSMGDFTFRLDLLGLPTGILRKGSTVLFRTGTWDGSKLGQYTFADLYMSVIKSNFVYNDETAYYDFRCVESSTISRLVVNETGQITISIWRPHKKNSGWFVIGPIQVDHCDPYGTCGKNSLCNPNSPSLCECLDGFKPRSPLEWQSLQWSSGCVRRIALNCSDEAQGFRKLSGIRLPDRSRMVGNRTSMRSSTDCEKVCLGNCSCSAYAWAEGVGCAVWHGDLQDMRLFYIGGQDLFIRMPASQLIGASKKGKHRRVLIASSVLIITGMFLLAITTWYGCHAMAARRKRRVIRREESLALLRDSSELPMIAFDELVAATNNFSDDNKLGAGGFGPVYKGILIDGQEIAVKRLSSFSGQGTEEFKNEILVISKLQHRNLVRLIGCSIHGEENGYMSPEYVMRGLFSEKSDVYSFEIILLEVISGRRNCGFHNQDNVSLLNYAWQLWIERREGDLIDESIINSCSFIEALRCIKIGLLCVQDHVSDRPTMPNVVLMLCSEIDIPQPMEPTFAFQNLSESDSMSNN
nr:G-type lectin S-receptor-like serine/threonine-protein kinase [Ipomoea batatas]